MPPRLSSIPLLACVATLLACSGEAPPTDPIPAHETFTLESAVLGETRTLNVWLPPGYAQSEAALPVLYMPDGGLAEDFPHIANTIAELVAAGTIAPLLVVGIENTQRRRDLTGPSSVASDADIAPLTDGAAAFRSFVADELIPEVEQRYRVRPDRRALLGESAAGLFVVETLFLRPELFQVYLAMDPALWWNDHELVKRAPERLREWSVPNTRFWFAASGAADIAPHCAALAEALEAAKAEGLEWRCVLRPTEQHSTIFRATKAEAFGWGLWKE